GAGGAADRERRTDDPGHHRRRETGQSISARRSAGGRGQHRHGGQAGGAVLTIGLATVHDVGITIDEFLFDGYGPKALAWYLSLGADRALTDHFGTWFYGPWFQIVTTVAQSFHAADDFDVRHALTFIVGLSGLAAVVPIGR